MGDTMNEQIRLPQAFCGRMERLLLEEYNAFLASYEKERYYGLRHNPLKSPAEIFVGQMPFTLDKIAWAREGYYYQAAQQPGRHVLHEAGAYYIQEPSAMAVAEILNPRPGERILDLCAAPGGKTTQIAGRMQGEGLLVANEIVPERARVLSQNVERMGVRNCVVCNEKPKRLAALFPGFFDRILVDAPCSGEGMFRKDEAARQEWSPAHVTMCAERQGKILEEAASMLKPGGVLVYSTCTFAPEENEGVISRFIRAHEDYIIEETDCCEAFSQGQPGWTDAPAAGIEYTMRLWPHKLKGEGHYIARLRRKKEAAGQGILPYEESDRNSQDRVNSADRISSKNSISSKNGKNNRNNRERTGDRKLREAVTAFLTQELGLPETWIDRQSGTVVSFGEQVYLVPEGMIPLAGVKVLRPGLCLLTDRKNRFEPAHALAMALTGEDTARVRELTMEEARRYLRGESIPCGQERGWILLTCEGYSLGFGKASGGQIKNHYPKGLRKNI